jgi:hypothetical protein
MSFGRAGREIVYAPVEKKTYTVSKDLVDFLNGYTGRPLKLGMDFEKLSVTEMQANDSPLTRVVIKALDGITDFSNPVIIHRIQTEYNRQFPILRVQGLAKSVNDYYGVNHTIKAESVTRETMRSYPFQLVHYFKALEQLYLMERRDPKFKESNIARMPTALKDREAELEGLFGGKKHRKTRRRSKSKKSSKKHVVRRRRTSRKH